MQQITDYNETGTASAGRCVIVPIDLNGGYIIWNLQERVSDYSGYKFVSTGKICYVRDYDDGTVSEIKTFDGDLSDCQPIITDGKAVWYVTKESEPIFYTLDDAGITATNVAPDSKPDTNRFTDVDSTAYYAKAVAWAVGNGITSGTGNKQFSPDMDCSRGQIVTFLWRAAGSPEPKTTVNPFSDVKSTDY